MNAIISEVIKRNGLFMKRNCHPNLWRRVKEVYGTHRYGDENRVHLRMRNSVNVGVFVNLVEGLERHGYLLIQDREEREKAVENVDRLSRAATESSEKFQETINSLKEKITKLEKENGAILEKKGREESNSSSESYENLLLQNSNLVSKLSNEKTSNSSLSSNLKTLKNKFETSQEELRKTERDVETEKAKIISVKEELKQAISAKTSSEKEEERVKNILSSMQSDTLEMKKQLSSQQHDILKQKEIIDKKEKELSNTQSSLQSKTLGLKTLLEALKQEKQKLQEEEKLTKNWKEEAFSQNELVASCRKERLDLRNEISRLSKENRELKTKLETITRDIIVLPDNIPDPKNSEIRLFRKSGSFESSCVLHKNDGEKGTFKYEKKREIIQVDRTLYVGDPLFLQVILRTSNKKIIREKDVRVKISHSKKIIDDYEYGFKDEEFSNEINGYSLKEGFVLPVLGLYSLTVLGMGMIIQTSLKVIPKMMKVKFVSGSEEEEVETNLPFRFARECSRRRINGDVFDTRRKVDKSFGSGVIFVLSKKSFSSKEEKSSKVKSGIIVRRKGSKDSDGSSKDEIFFETDSDGNIAKEECIEKMNLLVKMANVGIQEEEEEEEEEMS